MKRLLAAAATLLVVLLPVVVPAAAGAQEAEGEPSTVTVVHGIPGPTVDVYLDGSLTLQQFQPSTTKGPVDVPPGRHTVEIFPAAEGTPPPEPPGSGAVIDETITVPEGENVTLVAHLDEAGEPALAAFVNDMGEIADGEGRVTVRHTAAAPAVDIEVDGEPVEGLTGIEPGDEASLDLPAGLYPVSVVPAGGGDPVAEATLDVRPGLSLNVYAVGDPAEDTFSFVLQPFSGLGPQPTPTFTSQEADESGLHTTIVLASLVVGGLVIIGGTLGAVKLARDQKRGTALVSG